ncbi:hypothetical protein MICRO116_230027 [Micrococcus sp. 116]|nr:hypothetical protein MICRO116_230027 [Micrococcus sp. 116]
MSGQTEIDLVAFQARRADNTCQLLRHIFQCELDRINLR